MRLVSLAMVCTLVAACGGGGGGTTPPPPTPASVSISPGAPATFTTAGATLALTAVVRDASNNAITNATVSWSTSNSAVAIVSPATGSGTTVTSVGDGSATISARSGTAVGTVMVAVQQASATVTVTPSAPATLASIGSTVSLTAVVRDGSNNVIPNATVTWTTSNSAVATVSPSSGLSSTATSTGNGSATIAAHFGSVQGVSTVTVQQQLASVLLSPPSATILFGGSPNTVQLSATPRDANGNAISGLPAPIFTVDSPAHVTVSSGGLVTSQSIGSNVVTATVNGVASNGATITVSAPSGGGVHTTITANGTAFTPSTVTIRQGDFIDWTFVNGHTVTYDSGPVTMPNLGTASSPIAGQTISQQFNTPGTYAFHCEIHGTPTSGMRGTITVTP